MFDRDNINVFLRVQQGCNLNCEHCFTLGNQDKVLTTPFEYVEGFLSSIKNNVDPSMVTLYLHGGETFLAKLGYLKRVTEYAKSVFAHKKLVIIPQTNLVYRITDEWLDFIKTQCDGNIGVSWDAQIRFGSIKTEHQVRQEQLFFNNLKRLIAEGINVHISIVVQKHLLKLDPMKIVEMFEGVAGIDFEHLTVFNKKTKNLRVNLKEWSDWYDKLVDYYQNNQTSWCLPQVDLFTKSIEDGVIYNCKCNCCDRKTFTLNPNGTVGFCPDNSYTESVSTVQEMVEDWKGYEEKSHAAFIERLCSMSTENCFSCEHYAECGGNCEDYFFDDSGECPLSKKVISRIKQNKRRFIQLYHERAKPNLAELREVKK